MTTLISIDNDFNIIFENDAIEYSDDDKIALLTEATESIQKMITGLRYDYLFANEPVEP